MTHKKKIKKVSFNKKDADELRLRRMQKMPKQKYRHQQVWMNEIDDMEEELPLLFTTPTHRQILKVQQ